MTFKNLMPRIGRAPWEGCEHEWSEEVPYVSKAGERFLVSTCSKCRTGSIQGDTARFLEMLDEKISDIESRGRDVFEARPVSCGKCDGTGNPSFGHTKECRQRTELRNKKETP